MKNTLMRIILAAVISAVVGIAVDWLVSLKLFHRYRSRTPDTYRPAARRRPALMWSAIILAAFTYAIFFAVTGGIGWLNVTQWVRIGILFGIGCWMALALPLVLSLSVFVNLHRGVVIGLLVDWLLLSISFGIVCAAVMVR